MTSRAHWLGLSLVAAPAGCILLDDWLTLDARELGYRSPLLAPLRPAH